jgi:hypothetical protein
MDPLMAQVPFTYVLDYGLHLNDPDGFVAQVAQSPPDLLHVAYDTPFHNRWGPFHQFDSLYGRPVHLSPEEIDERILAVRDLVDRLHEAGVRVVVPYICNQTLGGDLDQRTGIWAFYDQWHAYSRFDFGKRPEADPVDWMARERNGRLHYNYEKRHRAFVQWEEFRYAPCMNNPHYNQYQRGLVLNIARVGYDGVFVDNNILSCYCDCCQKKFRAYLSDRYPPSSRSLRFGTDDLDQIHLGYRGNRIEWVKEDPEFRAYLAGTCSHEELESWFGTSHIEDALLEDAGNGWLWGRAGGYRRYLESRYSEAVLAQKFGSSDLSLWGIRTPEERCLWSDTKCFWAESVRVNLRMIREAGASVREGFQVVPNWGAMQRVDGAEYREEHGKDTGVWASGMDHMMYEEDESPGRVAHGVYLDYILPRRIALAHGVSSGNLCYCGSGAASNELAHAEAAAGGGGCFIQLGWAFPKVREKYRAFFDNHRDLFEGYRPHAEVGLVFFYDLMHMEHLDHVRQVYALTRYLLDRHILFDYLTEKDLAEDQLSECRVLILPEVRFMRDEHIDAVTKFVEKGGTAVVTGTIGRDDWNGASRSVDPFEGLSNRADGRFVYAPKLSDLIPQDGVSLDGLLGFLKGNLAKLAGEGFQGGYSVMASVDRVLRTDRFLSGGELGDHVIRGLGYDPCVADPLLGAGVRFQAYRWEDRNKGQMVVHAVNYNLPLTDPLDKQAIEPTADLPMRVRMPEGWTLRSVRSLAPGEASSDLVFEADGAFAETTLPTFDFYMVLEFAADIG